MDNYEGLIIFFKQELYQTVLKYNKRVNELENLKSEFNELKSEFNELKITYYDDQIHKVESELNSIKSDICIQAKRLNIDPNTLDFIDFNKNES